MKLETQTSQVESRPMVNGRQRGLIQNLGERLTKVGQALQANHKKNTQEVAPIPAPSTTQLLHAEAVFEDIAGEMMNVDLNSTFRVFVGEKIESAPEYEGDVHKLYKDKKQARRHITQGDVTDASTVFMWYTQQFGLSKTQNPDIEATNIVLRKRKLRAHQEDAERAAREQKLLSRRQAVHRVSLIGAKILFAADIGFIIGNAMYSPPLTPEQERAKKARERLQRIREHKMRIQTEAEETLKDGYTVFSHNDWRVRYATIKDGNFRPAFYSKTRTLTQGGKKSDWINIPNTHDNTAISAEIYRKANGQITIKLHVYLNESNSNSKDYLLETSPTEEVPNPHTLVVESREGERGYVLLSPTSHNDSKVQVRLLEPIPAG